MSGCVFPGLQCDGTAADTLCHRNLRAGTDCGVSERTVSCPRSDLPRTGIENCQTKRLYFHLFSISIHHKCFLFSLQMQVALNQAYNEMINSASDLLSTTMEEQSSLMKEVRVVI